jgi:N-acetylmuramoyl-L-alanine amidase
VTIDTGHTPDWYETYKDKGTILNDIKIEEYTLNKLIADNVYNFLKNEGVLVYRTPTYEKSCLKSTYKKAVSHDLNLRTNYINKIKPKLSLSFHHDYNNNGNVRGFTIYRYINNGTTKTYKARIGKKFKENVPGIKECGLNTNGYSDCYNGHQGFSLVMKILCDSMLIENGFFSSQQDVNLTKNYYKLFAKSIVEGLMNKTIEIGEKELYEDMPYTKWMYDNNLIYGKDYKSTDKFTVEQIGTILKRFYIRFIK